MIDLLLNWIFLSKAGVGPNLTMMCRELNAFGGISAYVEYNISDPLNPQEISRLPYQGRTSVLSITYYMGEIFVSDFGTDVYSDFLR
jgi:hypothetical protein